ncbi:hypothetical protein A5819_001728 [Enterococcus sp. 7E2_DIV0204]|uniref:DUF3958 family protein n=1 Tax=unclassified Enterococcus TaxID=2608891 RepID=UPI000A338C4E|nr:MULTISPECIES: DUF3958 family protein [unclassified Enterococcus]OTN89236.1 hypothetical protein A5819_001728 [Enterococcus sp. 7E2_DIV0204]OTP51686.1 hypothetical protein A5884_000881 [Enterococcus sp. 7D2_DIV0200]
MNLTSQQQVEDKNYQYRIRLEELQDEQVENKKERRFLESLQEQFYHAQQQENQLYQQSLNEVEPEERAFFEERLDEVTYLSRKALQEFEKEQEQLQQDYKKLLENENSVRSEQLTFLKNDGEENVSGT